MIPGDLEFVAQEVLTGRMLGNVNLASFSVKETINDFGEWSGELLLSVNDRVSPLELTEPWKVRLFALRGGDPIRCLDIWTRSRTLGSSKVTLNGRLGGSWLSRVVIGQRNNQDLTYSQIDQQAIAVDLVRKATAEWGEWGCEVPTTGTGTVLRDKTTWDASDGKPYGEALIDLANLQNGFQFAFEPYVVSQGKYGLRMVTGHPYIPKRAPIVAELTSDGYSMSGNIRSLQIEESVASYATDVMVLGSGEGAGRLRGKARNTPLSGGIPSLSRTESRVDIIGQEWLNQRAETILAASDTPMFPPQVGLSVDDPNYPLGSYRTGDAITVYVDPCPELPYGLDGTWRIMEIDYKPAVSTETVILTIGDRT